MRTVTSRATAVLAVLALALAACGNGDDGDTDVDDAPTDEADDAGDVTEDDAEQPDDEADDAGDVTEDDAEQPDDEADDEEAAEPDGDPVEVEMVVFAPPSLGAFLPAVIEDQEFDLANGIDLQFTERPPDAYSTEYGSGQFELGGSASLISEAVRRTEGVETEYLFNVFDFFAAVVSTTDEVQELSDLEGRDLAAATSTTSYAMFLWFAQQQDVDMNEVSLQNTATPGLVTQALTGRSSAVQLWEPAYSTLLAQQPDIDTLDMGLEAWEERFGFTDIPYLGVAAHRSWIDENEDLVPDLQQVYEDAAEWILANPEDAADIIAGSMEDADAEPLVELIGDNDRLGLNVYAAGDAVEEIQAVFEVGQEIDYFDEAPDDDVIYGAGE